jgi:hypothetical protein
MPLASQFEQSNDQAVLPSLRSYSTNLVKSSAVCSASAK